tara:strand:+ start:3787 stop:4881 length:1095 start_codon:yes stop_codon:yes gene_type:complete
MTWLALCDHDDRRLSLRGLGVDKRAAPLLADDPRHLLTRGTILFETHMMPDERPRVLFGYKTPHPVLRSLTFQAIPGGGIAMVQVQGDAITHAAIQHKDAGRTDVMRISYSWDSTAKWGRLTLEKPEETKVTSVVVPHPRPLSLDDIRNLMLGRGGQSFGPDMIFAALSDQIEPVGPMPTMTADTPVATPWGYRPLAKLRRGDTVMTETSGVVPVLHQVSRTVPARGSYRPVRLRAPYFGLQQDIIVAPDQRIKIDGPEVEYLFNQEAVLVPARHLVNGFAALNEPCGPVIQYAQLLLPGHDTMLAAGTAAESLYIGRLRRNAAQLESSVLRGLDRAGLPEHGRPGHQVLRWFEAIHLARQRAA